jgi:hypothetical protein
MVLPVQPSTTIGGQHPPVRQGSPRPAPAPVNSQQQEEDRESEIPF